jgi:hypothetical protein
VIAGLLAGLFFRWNVQACIIAMIAGVAIGIFALGMAGIAIVIDAVGSIAAFLVGSIVSSIIAFFLGLRRSRKVKKFEPKSMRHGTISWDIDDAPNP